MKIPPHLDGLSKRDLIRLILEQNEKIVRLEEKNTVLESRLKKVEALLRQFLNPNVPSSQKRFKKGKKNEHASLKERFPGREKGHEGAGIKLPEPDMVEEHTIDKKGYKLVGKRAKTVIDFVENPLLVIKHVIYKYKTPDGSIVEPEVNLPKGVYGKNLQAFNCLLKGKLGASYESIADLIRALRPDISFCKGTSQTMIDNMAGALTPLREEIREEIRNSFYCNADETGLSHDGVNGYAWFFGTPTHALYETDLSRSKTVVERVLGKSNDSTIVCDGWSAYHGYTRQRCWPHLLRELDFLAEDDKQVKVQANYLHSLYKRALETKKKPPNARFEFVRKANSQTELGYTIEALSKIKKCKEFTTTLKNAQPHLFTGVIHPEIPLDNNHAERMLRKIVVHRKLMGCIRNKKGQKFIENVMSAIQTWHLQRKNPYKQLKNFAS